MDVGLHGLGFAGFFRFCKGFTCLLSGCTVLGKGRCDKGLGLIFWPDLTKAS